MPAGPVMGDSTTPTTSQPSARAAAMHLSTAAWRFSGSRTTPPLPTSPLPTSNCGLTSAMIGLAPGPAAATSVGRTSVSEMKLTSHTTSSGWNGKAARSSVRALVCSMDVTRGSVRSLCAS